MSDERSPEASPALAEDDREKLGGEDRTARRAACDGLVARLSAEPGLERAIRGLLADPDPRTRFSAAWILFRARGPQLRLLPALLAALELDDGDLRWSATHMLSALASVAPEALQVALHQTLHAPSDRVRRMALYAVRDLLPGHPEAASGIRSALQDPAPEVRRAALACLARLPEPQGADLEHALRLLSDDRDPRMQRIAAVVVPDLAGRVPERQASAREALEQARQHSDPSLARAAAAALSRLCC